MVTVVFNCHIWFMLVSTVIIAQYSDKSLFVDCAVFIIWGGCLAIVGRAVQWWSTLVGNGSSHVDRAESRCHLEKPIGPFKQCRHNVINYIVSNCVLQSVRNSM